MVLTLQQIDFFLVILENDIRPIGLPVAQTQKHDVADANPDPVGHAAADDSQALLASRILSHDALVARQTGHARIVLSFLLILELALLLVVGFSTSTLAFTTLLLLLSIVVVPDGWRGGEGKRTCSTRNSSIYICVCCAYLSFRFGHVDMSMRTAAVNCSNEG